MVKLQAINLAAKLFVLSPSDHTLGLLSRYVFSLARYDTNYDVRDRARMLTSLLSGITPTPLVNGAKSEDRGGVVLRREQVRLVLMDGKSGIAEDDFDQGVIAQLVDLLKETEGWLHFRRRKPYARFIECHH